MIPLDFSYNRPDTLAELKQTLTRLSGQDFRYYAGGSEIITMTRTGSIAPDAVIDIKNIPECSQLMFRGDELYIGGAVTLSEIAGSGLFPMMGTTVSRIADHTNQCRITVAGNLCGTIFYREAALPLLIADAKVHLWRDGKTRTQRYQSPFAHAANDLVLGFSVPKANLAWPYFHIKRTRADKIDYPLLTVTASYAADWLRIAISGVCNFPFRAADMERIAINKSISIPRRVDQMCDALPADVIDDLLGSAEFRIATLKNVLLQILSDWEALYAA